MKSLKYSIIKAILYLGRKTYLGRGKIRKLLIYLIEKILSFNDKDLKKSLFITKLWDFEVNFYADRKTGLKLYFERNENVEINYLKKTIPSKSWFIDIGSNIGLYSLNVLNLNNKNKIIKVLSIEPNKVVFNRLISNISLLKKRNKYIKNNIKLLNKAIGEKKTKVFIDTSYDHANAKIEKNLNLINKKKLKTIQMDTLTNIIKNNKIKRIYCIKIDTEGYEYPILKQFFKNISISLYPKLLIVEHNNDPKSKKIDRFLLNYRYEIMLKTNSNTIYTFNE